MGLGELENWYYGMVWYGMISTHLGSIHASHADVDRLSFQSCIVFNGFRRYWFRIIICGLNKVVASRTSLGGRRHMSELEWTAPAKTRRVIEVEIIRITHAVPCVPKKKKKKEKRMCARGAPMPVSVRVIKLKSGIDRGGYYSLR